MKAYIHCIVDDKFTSEDTGEIIEYANCYAYTDEHFNTETRKGIPITKVRVKKGLISTIEGSNLPGWFECENGIAAGGKLLFTRLKHLPNEKAS